MDYWIYKSLFYRSLLLSSFALCMLTFSADAEVYKYTDENGKTHYSDKPFKKDSEVVEIKTKKPQIDQNQTERQITRDKMLEIYAEEREQKKEEQAIAKEERKKRKAECKALQMEQKDYKRNDSRLYELDENGERYFLSDDDIKQRIAQLQELIDEVCLKKWLF